MYSQGQGVPQDYVKAAEFYQKSADQGFAPALAALGEMYIQGQGVPKDVEKGHGLLRDAKARRKAQEQKSQGAAYFIMGTLYFDGQGRPKDLAMAALLFQKAADQGEPRAQNYLGVMYLKGLGVSKDAEKGCGLPRDALAKGVGSQEEIDHYCPQ